MLFNAKNATLSIHGSAMDYIHFGSGPRTLIILPGLGDGLRTVKGTALPMALMYRCFSRDFTVYAFSRKHDLPEGSTTRDMAQDLKDAMDALHIEKADVLGVSMGGMIAQQFAIHFPERLNKLVLAVTCPRPNPILEESIAEWLSCVQAGDHAALMDSNLRRIYSDGYYQKSKKLIPLLGKLTKPKSYTRFVILANACLNHDASHELSSITAKTLVIGGQQDIALGADASRELASSIPGSTLKIYPQWGHGLYEEASDFNDIILEFLRS